VGVERERLRELLQSEAIQVGEFILSSGKRANYYIDCRLVTLSAEGAYLTGRVMLDALGAPLPDAVAGMSVAADPVVTAIAIASHSTDTPIQALIVRSRAKEHGTGKQVEGPLQPGMQVAIVEDTVTTGGSVLRAAEAVTGAGGEVTGVWTLVDRLQGGAAAIKAAGLAYQHVFTIEDLGVDTA
jgi:orotate phosphoribosyltransferase